MTGVQTCALPISTEGLRLDYLFQGGYVPFDQSNPAGFKPIDISNRTLSVTVTSLKTR